MRTTILLAAVALSLVSQTALAAQKPKKKKVEPAPAPPPAPVVVETPPPPPPPSPPKAVDKPVEPPPASEEEEKPISIAPLLGYATNHANFGIGVRGGYTLPMHLYVGGTVVYHFGTSNDVPSFGGKTVTASAHILYPGVEVGYDIHAGPVIVRPYGGVGLGVALVSLGDESDSKSSLALWPGCQVTYDIPRSPVFVGGDARLLVMTSGGDPSFGMFATAGMRL